MPEYLEVNGELKEVPPDVLAEGREAVARWYEAQLGSGPSAPAVAPRRRGRE